MGERVIEFVIGLVCLGIAVLMAMGTRHNYQEYARTQDFTEWAVSPGKLKSLQLTPAINRSVWRYRVDGEYSYEHNGVVHTDTNVDFANPRFEDVSRAQAWVEAVLDVQGRVTWERKAYGDLEAWVMLPPDLPIKVRHSTTRPDTATLSDTPPLADILSWIVMVLLGLMTAMFALTGPVMLYAAFMPPDKLPTKAALAMGNAELPRVPFRQRDRYASLLEAALQAAAALRAAEGGFPALDSIVETLQAEQSAAHSEQMRQRRMSLHLRRSIDLKGDTPEQASLDQALSNLDEFLKSNLVVPDPNRRETG